MIDPEQFAIAQSYRSLADNAAMMNLLRWLEDCSEFAERRVLSTIPADTEDSRLTLFVEWQTRRKVYREIQKKLIDAAKYLQELEQEQANERATADDRANRGNW